MGNITSYFSAKQTFEEYIGQIDEKPIDGSHQTPARCNRTNLGTNCFDPRSPTFDIDRTPIVVRDLKLLKGFDCQVLIFVQIDTQTEDNGPEDPRSPSCGITRTPVYPTYQLGKEPAIEKEREELIQVLNFTDLDCLSLSNIEEDLSVSTEEDKLIVNTELYGNTEQVEHLENPELISTPAEEILNISSSIIAVSSTPKPSPVKPLIKVKRAAVIVDENSLTKSNSPLSGVNVPLVRPRVPFGDVNRPSLASPRLHLQNKQRHIVRSEIFQHQQRYNNKID